MYLSIYCNTQTQTVIHVSIGDDCLLSGGPFGCLIPLSYKNRARFLEKIKIAPLLNEILDPRLNSTNRYLVVGKQIKCRQQSGN